jgi:ubiquinone biosynthesis protein COQ9
MSEGMRERLALKDRVLESALQHAAFDGWTKRTLMHAADDTGLEHAAALRLFPQGGDSLVAWLDDWADRRMLEAISPDELERMPIRRRISRLVRARFEALAPHREAVRRAALARSLPQNAFDGSRALWRTVDRIWQAAGLPSGADRGFSYYSRRTTLAGVLVGTFLYWLEDHSEGSSDSWAFLERRIDDVMRFGRATASLKSIFGGLPGGARAAR